MTEITIQGRTYQLATNLRVAYEVQNQNNHKPYLAVFQEVDEQPLEKQIEILWIAAKAVKDQDVPDKKTFIVSVLDDIDFNIVKFMEVLKAVFIGITGKNPEEVESTETASNSGE